MNKIEKSGEHDVQYQAVFGDVSKIINAARDSATRSVNASITAAYWLIGYRIVEFEQSGEERAEYGAALLKRLAEDLTGRFGRGFSRQNIQNMRMFYLSFPPDKIRQTLSGKLGRPPLLPIRQTPFGNSEPVSIEVSFDDLLAAFPLPWSAYVRLLSVTNELARDFYECRSPGTMYQSSPGSLIHPGGRFELFLSPFIMEEIAGVLGRNLGWDEERSSQALTVLGDAATIIEPRRLPEVGGSKLNDRRWVKTK